MTARPTRIDYDGLMACARGEMFGPGNPQLPAPPAWHVAGARSGVLRWVSDWIFLGGRVLSRLGKSAGRGESGHEADQ